MSHPAPGRPAAARSLGLILLAIGALLGGNASAGDQAAGSRPEYFLKFAGSLPESDGSLFSGSRTFVFELFGRERGEAPIWSEQQEIEVRDGRYSTLLGVSAPLTAPPGDGYALAVRVEGVVEPLEVHEISIAVPAGRDGVARTAGTPIYRLLPSTTGRRGRGRMAAMATAAAVSEPADQAMAQAGAAASGPRLLFVGVEVEETSGNTDGSLEPGETVNLKVKLYNDGNELASSIFGTLDYLGTNPDVTILDKTASWPNLAARGAPALTDSPHFQVQLAGTLACGTVLPFRVEVTTGTGGIFDLDFSLKAGQRLDYDMLHDAIRRFNEQEANLWGADPGDKLGSSVAWGDINGDGRADLILGASEGDSVGNARGFAGEVYLIYGRSSQWTETDLLSPGTGVARFWGADPTDVLGISVASGDLNGDGFDDLILGAELADGQGNARANAGEVYLIYGRSSEWTDTDLLSPAPGVARFWGADSLDLLGSSVASGDVNGDGFDDLILGAKESDSSGNARNAAGEVYLIYGRSTQWIDTNLLTPPSGVARFWGAEPFDTLGSSVASGDVNGDGFDDLILGAVFGDSVGNTRFNAGEVYVIYGRSSQWTDTDLLTPPSGVARFWGVDEADRLGISVTSGDVDGDGFDDLILGADDGDSVGNTRFLAGEVYLIYGRSSQWTDTDLLSPATGVARFWGADNADHLGFSVTSGDVDGDGFDDLILGAFNSSSAGSTRLSAGAVYLIYGRSSPWTDTDLLTPAPDVSRFWGADTFDHLGFSVGSGDVDGDGFDDVILGAVSGASAGNARPDAGEVYLWYGKPVDTHYARSDTYSFIDASVGAGLPALACDDCSTTVPIGFSFPFHGEEYSTIHVSSNGLISFAPISDLASANPICIPARNPSNLLVAPFWDDLNPAAGGAGSGVFTLLQGTAPNRRLTIEWKDVPHYPATGGATFEVTLFESSGQILVQYGDTIFGNSAFDGGAAAVAGLENGKGAQGTAYSCFSNNLLTGSTAVRFIPTTPLIETRPETATPLWSTTGLWHLSTGACEPDQHTGSTGWYYGQDATCDYNTASVNSGSLRAPTVPDFPADARLAYWYRRQAEAGTFDLSKVQLSTTGTGGSYGDIQQTTDSTNVWLYAGVTNIFSAPAATVDLRFFFDTVDNAVNNTLGWMVDDVQLVGCDATGAPSMAAAATAFAQPDTFCEGDSGVLDALGSFCGDSGSPSGYQWRRDGLDLAGATSLMHAIPPTEPAGVYDYSVAISCPGGAMDESDAQQVTIVAPPEAVGPTLELLALPNPAAPASLKFTWTDVTGADDYVVLQDTTNGPFTTVTGTASSGSPGLTVPLPPGSLVYFLVAGRNAVCGEGPKQ
ncbi:MAG: FG-GAP repeat protein [Candidatus Polarisedimenticolia bacterium]